MHIHVRVHHWVIWWFGVGLVCGTVALVNILSRNLTRSQEDVVLAMGVIHWVLGGIVCYSFDGVRILGKARPLEPQPRPKTHEPETEWHSASEFLQPGRHKHLLPR
jgi:hypothetical protein